jgi:hypothetical protein
MDEVGDYSLGYQKYDLKKRIERVRDLWDAFPLNEHSLQLYFSSKDEDMSNMRLSELGVKSPTKSVSIWLGSLRPRHLTELIEHHYKEDDSNPQEIAEATHHLYEWSGGVPRFVDRALNLGGSVGGLLKEGNLKRSMDSLAEDTLDYWKKNKGLTEYIVMLYLLSKWALAVPPNAKVGKIAKCLRTVCSEGSKQVWRNEGYNEMKLIDLVRKLIAYVGLRSERTDTIVVSLPKVLTASHVFSTLIAESHTCQHLRTLADWTYGLSNDRFEVLIPYIMELRISLVRLHGSTCNIEWQDIIKGMEGTVLGAQALDIQDIRLIPSVVKGKGQVKAEKSGRWNHFLETIRSTAPSFDSWYQTDASGPHLYQGDWKKVLLYAVGQTLYVRKAQSHSDDAFLIMTPVLHRGRFRKHIVLFQYKKYFRETRLESADIQNEIRKTLIAPLLNCSPIFCSLVIITTSEEISIGEVTPAQKFSYDNGCYVVKGGAEIKAPRSDSSCLLPKNTELIILDRKGVASILPGL